jgi:hypothetical protein
MKHMNAIAAALLTAMLLDAAAAPARAQRTTAPPSYDPATRLRAVLPADVAERVLARIADAHARGLLAKALERTALRGAARAVAAQDIERAVGAQAERLEAARTALAEAKGRRPSGDEIEAAADAMRRGVDGGAVAELAKDAASGRSLAVPLYVLGSLVARGLSPDQALSAVADRLRSRASDEQIAQLPDQIAAQRAERSDETGRDLAGARRPGGGTPSGVPANAGAGARPRIPPPPAGGRP